MPDDEGEVVIEIEYVRPENLERHYVTGARIFETPYHVTLDFFIDSPIDPVAGEDIIEKDGKRSPVAKRAYDGPKRLQRQFKTSITLPMRAVTELANALAGYASKKEK